MKKPLEKGYRVSIYNDSSWGLWVTVGEYRTHERAEIERTKFSKKGYKTSIAKF